MVSFSVFHYEIYRKGNKKKMATKIKRLIRLEHFGFVCWNTSTSTIFNALRNVRHLVSLVTLDFISYN